MTFSLSEVILGATVPLTNGSTVTFSIAGKIETERDCDDAVVIFSRKLLKYTNSASDADRLTVRQVVASITSTPLDKVPDVGTPTPEPAKTPTPATLNRVASLPERMPAPTVAEQAATAVRTCIKPPTDAGGGEDVFVECDKCGGAVTKSQAKLSQLFQSKTLCKKCMEAP